VITARQAEIAEGGAAVPRRSWPNERQLAALALFAIAAVAIALRLIPIVVVPSVDWPDEIFQVLEPAHRLAYGYGLVAWEFQLGVRSWLMPGLVTGMMEFSRIFGEGPDYYLPAVTVGLAAIGAIPVLCCFQMCRCRFGLRGAVVGAMAVAIAPELVYFGGRTLTEVLAGHLLVLACYLLDPAHLVPSRRRIAVAGALLALVCVARIHLAPVVAVVGLWFAWGLWRDRLVPLIVAGTVTLMLGALFDFATAGAPLPLLSRFIPYVRAYGFDAHWTTDPWYYYFSLEFAVWGGAIALVAILVGIGARQAPLFLVAAVATIVVHSAIGHKEYRYFYPAIVMFMVLAGIGLAYAATWGGERLRDRGWRGSAAAGVAAIVALLCWSATATQAWTGPAMTALRYRWHDQMLAARFTSRLPAICGLGLYGYRGTDWLGYGGYAWLHHPVPMYWPAEQSALTDAAPAFDTLIYVASDATRPPEQLEFKTLHCFGSICVAQRQGRCEARPMAPMPFPEGLEGVAPPLDKFPAVMLSARPAPAERYEDMRVPVLSPRTH
jgi:hypothetical protein